MIKYFVRTTLERTLDESFSQIEYELLVDTKHGPNESFIEQLDIISDFDAVLLEDDVVLCKDFKETIERVINENKNYVINFFTRPTNYFTSHYSQWFVYNQCTYYPKGVGKILAKQMRQDMLKMKGSGYDLIEMRSITNLDLTVYNYRPCLVQHKDIFSLIGHSSTDRITPYFKDYLDKYGIDYNNPSDVMKRKDLLEFEKAEFCKMISTPTGVKRQ